MTKKDKKAIEEAFIRISAKDPHCSSCIFRTEWDHIGKLLRNILENNQVIGDIKADIEKYRAEQDKKKEFHFLRMKMCDDFIDIIDKHIN